MATIPFCSRKSEYKLPFGAVDDKTAVTYRIMLPEYDGVASARFILRNDEWETAESHEMTAAESGIFTYTATLPEGLYWYSFEFDDRFGVHRVTRFEHGEGYVSDEGKDWQQTVYSADFAVPSWFSGGLMYQIFPDRFAVDGELIRSFDDRYYQYDITAEPSWRQDIRPAFGADNLGNDYFGGNFRGITGKLDYIASLGVSCIYLNPIFEAHSNHRYNTADYTKTDPTLGSFDDFEELCSEARKRGIRIILDGVFSHTGDDSVYFNKRHRYDSNGAYNSTSSEYYEWYKFEQWPDKYHSWWGIDTLPEVMEESPEFLDFICGKDGIARRWLRAGISGWRLDVADELPDEFLENFRLAVKQENPDALIIGEVWEDASNKISYGSRRNFLRGHQLDSVMNYPFREAIIAFLTTGQSRDFIDAVMSVLENYPKAVVDSLMNHIGTHDTPRILTILGGDPQADHDREWQSGRRLDEAQLAKGLRLVKMAAVLQYTLPGVPSLYYGDEAGEQGYGDPFNRAFYPWGKENSDLIEFYRLLGQLRKKSAAFDGGEFIPLISDGGRIVYVRSKCGEQVLVAVNRFDDPSAVQLDEKWITAEVILGSAPIGGTLIIPGKGAAILKIK